MGVKGIRLWGVEASGGVEAVKVENRWVKEATTRREGLAWRRLGSARVDKREQGWGLRERARAIVCKRREAQGACCEGIQGRMIVALMGWESAERMCAVLAW